MLIQKLGLGVLFLTMCLKTQAAVDGAERVVIIGVDGLSPNGIRRSETPNIRKIMAAGAHTFHARAVMPTSSSPNWASMIMGAGPEQHGITSNDWETTILLITADHGGKGTKHGGATMEEIEIPWIISGPGVAQLKEIKTPVNTFDTAPTVAHILGVTPPSCWIGKPVLEACLANSSGVSK